MELIFQCIFIELQTVFIMTISCTLVESSMFGHYK